jgi:hypothetical protein
MKKRRDQRRAEARERQRACDRLTVDERLARLDARGFAAVRERLRLAERKVGVRWTP